MDQTIYMKEWLQYAVQRVPTLYEEVQSGRFKARGVKSQFGINAQNLGQAMSGLQQPSLFNFRKTQHDLVLDYVTPVSRP